MKKIIQLVLLVAIVLLAWLLYRQFATPMEFQKMQSHREGVVIERLKDIRTAQRAFKQAYSRYTPSFDTLINFVLHDSMTYQRAIGSEDDSVAVARGLVRREIFKVAVKDTIYHGRGLTTQDIENLRFIPFSNGKQFLMDAGALETGSKVVVQVFEAKAPYKEFLDEEDYHQELVNLIDQRKTINRYPGIKVGSMTEATNDAGNWE